MYKLTYESDEDILAQGLDENGGTGDHAKKRENESVIFEKSDLAYSHNRWTPYPDYTSPHVEGRPRSETLQSTANAAYGIENQGSNSKAAPSIEAKKKFYSLFHNTSTDSITSKQKGNSSHSGCCLCIVVVYLLLLTAALAIAFVHLYELRNETYTLQHRLRNLEHSAPRRNNNPLAEKNPKALLEKPHESSARKTRDEVFEAKFVISDEYNNRKRSNSDERSVSLPGDHGQDDKVELVHQERVYESPSNANSCCHSLQRSLAALDAKILESTRTLSEVQKLDSNFSSESTTRISELEKNMMTLELTLKNNMDAETKAKLELMNLKYQLKTLKKEKLEIPNQKAVAFSAHRVPNDLIIDIDEEVWEDFLDKRQQASSPPVDLFFDYELFNKKQDMDPESGTFTVPLDGFYTFQIVFCTNKDGWNTTVALVVNDAPKRTFSTPIISSTDIFDLDPTDKKENTRARSIMHRHSYSALLDLRKGEKIKLQLVSGSIVETSKQERESCTQFSGFKIS